MLDEAVVAYLKVISQHLSGGGRGKPQVSPSLLTVACQNLNLVLKARMRCITAALNLLV